MQDKKQPEKENRRKNVIIIVVMAIIIILLVTCIVLLVTRSGNSPDVPDTSRQEDSNASAVLERGFVDNDSAENIVSDMAEQVAEGMFRCTMTGTWTFEDSDSVSPNAYVANAADNRHTFYFDVYLQGTDEVIYSSPLLPVGSEFREIKLDKELEAGDYEAVVMYTLVDENYEEVSSAGFTITISVLH